MPVYLMRFSYTPETWSRLIQNPEDRRDAARAYIEQVGGALHGFWYGFGKYDGYAIYEAPDNASMAGAVLAISAGGALASVETTVLMTVEETLEALAALRPIRRELIVDQILGHDFVGEGDVSAVPELLGEPLHKPLVVGLR